MRNTFGFITEIYQHPKVRALRVGQFFLAVGIFFYAALMPADNAPPLLPPFFLHVIGNILLVLSMSTAFFPRLSITAIFCVCATLSSAAEWAQSLTGDRDPNMIDLTTNLLGLLAGATIAFGVRWLWRKCDTSHSATDRGDHRPIDNTIEK